MFAGGIRSRLIGVDFKDADLRGYALHRDGIQHQDTRLNPDGGFDLLGEQGFVAVELGRIRFPALPS